MKTCVQCSAEFHIASEDQKFYERMQISAPTHCAECRVRRRMAWRNDRSFSKRKCSLSGKSFVSIYPPHTVFPVYHPDEWYGDKWNPLDYGQDVDFSRPFFEQFKDLMTKVPRLGIDIVNCQNSYYCNYCGDDKNCYLDIAGEANEDCYYNLFTKYSKNCVDCIFAYHSELCYESLLCYTCYNVRYSMHMENCNDCSFCFDLKGCKDCLFSTNLRNKKYYILNKPYSKEEYHKRQEEMKSGSFSETQKYLKIWKEQMQQAIHRDMYILNSENCMGNNIQNSKNCYYAFNVTNSEDCSYLYDVLDAKTSYDLNYSLYKPEMACELISTLNMRFSAFCMASHYCHETYYSDQCNNSDHIFGCIGLNHGKYCILNKQYSKEEYEELLPKIIEYMKHTKEYGEFFPALLSPWGYNETVAHEYFPISQKEATEQGYTWKDIPEQELSHVTKRIPASKLPDKISDIPDDILNWALECSESQRLFKIQKEELEFHRKMNLPIPHLHPEIRHQHRMALRTPRKLWQRKCTKTGKEIWTTYSPKRPEKVYSEEAYLKEVY